MKLLDLEAEFEELRIKASNEGHVGLEDSSLQ